MQINNLRIINIAGIHELYLTFNRQMNIICGPNGIGKTTILECIAHSCSYSGGKILKRRADSATGEIFISLHKDKEQPLINRTIRVTAFEPSESTISIAFDNDVIKNLLSLKIGRTFTHKELSSVSRDAVKEIGGISSTNISGVTVSDVKNWFVNRYLYSAHANALTPVQLSNLEHSKTFFSLLNSKFQFSHVDASSNEIIIDTPAGKIFYEYLSSGFKSTLSILFGVTKEIELRFKSENVKIEDFNGVILIDELELHLHPEWQARIVEVLKKAFPCAQFIVSTHSPHIIQIAKPDEIIALIQDGNVVIQKEVTSGRYGFQGWSIEEILLDIMGMSDTRTNTYHEALLTFQNAVGNDNYELASCAFNQLDEMLHPHNHQRKLFAFQLGALKG